MNTRLIEIFVPQNAIEVLNLDNCTELERVDAIDNELTSFSVKNGNNENIRSMRVNTNYDLACVEVDNAYAATNNLYHNEANWGISSWMVYSNDCSALEVEEYQLEQLSIYPNPVIESFSINNITNNLINHITIYNQLGMLVKQTNQTEVIDISQLEKGVYFVKIETLNTNSITKQLIKS